MDEQKTEGIVDDFSDVRKLKDDRGFWDVYEDLIKAHVKLVESDNTSAQVRDDYRKYYNEFYEVDPDGKSESLKAKHQKIWSKELPNKEEMKLMVGKPSDLTKDGKKFDLKWERKGKDIRYSSDTIFTCFIRSDQGDIFREVLDYLKGEQNYLVYIEGYLRECYRNIGSFTIFPTFPKEHSINFVRGGGNEKIRDRFDLTLECIRRYYEAQESPLSSVLNFNREFLDLFENFTGYVDFFCLQDLVNGDYTHVRDLMRGGFVNENSFENPFPQNVIEYKQWMENQLEFVQKRTKRINQTAIGKH